MATLDNCKYELDSIVRELGSIESDLRYSFTGIGQDQAADCVGAIKEKYQYLQKKLRNVDYNRLADWIIN